MLNQELIQKEYGFLEGNIFLNVSQVCMPPVRVQEAYGKFDGIVINPAAYTHTSVAILDAVKGVAIPTVEVHISRVEEREAFRQISYIRAACEKTIPGHGTDGYVEAIDFLMEGK